MGRLSDDGVWAITDKRPSFGGEVGADSTGSVGRLERPLVRSLTSDEMRNSNKHRENGTPHITDLSQQDRLAKRSEA